MTRLSAREITASCRRIHHGGLLVHVVDLVRESRGDRGPSGKQYVCWDSSSGRAGLHRRPASRRARSDGHLCVARSAASQNSGASGRATAGGRRAKTVLFACVHNAGRSQMAAAWFNDLADPTKARAISAGTEPAERVHHEVVEVMKEVGLDLSHQVPQLLSEELARNANLLVTMGCGEACPIVPGVERVDFSDRGSERQAHTARPRNPRRNQTARGRARIDGVKLASATAARLGSPWRCPPGRLFTAGAVAPRTTCRARAAPAA